MLLSTFSSDDKIKFFLLLSVICILQPVTGVVSHCITNITTADIPLLTKSECHTAHFDFEKND